MATSDKFASAPRRAASRALRIESRDNRWLKRFRSALRGEPSADGAIGLEGPHLVEEALRAGIPVEALLIGHSGERFLEQVRPQVPPSVPVLLTTDKLFTTAADTDSPQGVAALIKPRVAAFEDLVRGVALVIVLVGVQDPGNVGTIVRAAEAFGATGVAACPATKDSGTANPFSPKAIRASAGSALRLPILRGAAAPILLAQFRVAGVESYAAVSRSSQAGRAFHPRETDLRKPAALLIGNEGAGLPPEIERSAGKRVQIPLAEGVESLNAAMAATVLLYEAARQRGAD